MSIRLRLTVAIALFASILGGFAAFFGLALLEDRVRSQAVSSRIEDLREIAENGFVSGDDFLFSEFEEFGDDFDDPVDLAPETDVDSLISLEIATEVLFAAERLERAGLLSSITEAFGDDDDQLRVLLYDGAVVRIDREDQNEPASLVEFGPADEPLILGEDLIELVFGIDGAQVEQSELDQSLELSQVELDGIDLAVIVDVSDELEALDQLNMPFLLSVVVLTVLAAGGTAFITGRALAPVKAITDQVADISSGNLRDRVPEPSRPDEIGMLARTMNQMLGRLESSDLRRRQFVSDASHELRTPVAVLRSEAEVAQRVPDSTDIDRFSSVVLEETTRLTGLVEDLLALARSDEGHESKVIPQRIEVDVDDIVLAEAARSRRVPAGCRDVSAGRVRTNADDLRRVITHLLDNAARHAESKVEVGVSTEGSTVRIWIDDDGVGVPEAARERVFERFVRLDDARTRDAGGAGLGLAVAKTTIESMSGRIECRESPLGGARFEVVLPKAM